MVQHLLLPNIKKWDEEKINSLFPIDVAKEILVVPLLELVRDDKLIWSAENGGVYSVRHASDLDASKFAVLMWYIWQQRNNKVWNDNNVSANQLGLQAASYWNQWAVINGLLQDQQQPDHHRATANDTVQWQQPPTGFLKCNVDASFFHSNGATGWGWCLRDSRGYFKLAGTNVVNSPLNVLVGEALAIIEAMEENSRLRSSAFFSDLALSFQIEEEDHANARRSYGTYENSAVKSTVSTAVKTQHCSLPPTNQSPLLSFSSTEESFRRFSQQLCSCYDC
ncbi:hypothetical protein QL285_082625 [Trifolium repens]|nr:hypothetical protein QL285_082625 [Trifolium repens]